MLLRLAGTRLAGARAATSNLAARSTTSAIAVNALAARSVSPIAVRQVRRFSSNTASNVQERITMSLADYTTLSRRIKNLSYLAGIPAAGAGVIATSYLTAKNFPEIYDPKVPPPPVEIVTGFFLDPIFCAVLASSTFMVVSFFVGMNMFRSSWRLFNSAKARQMDMRKHDLAMRVYKSRTKVEVEKMADDFYGSSIRDTASYRQWLKSQRARRKAEEKIQ